MEMTKLRYVRALDLYVCICKLMSILLSVSVSVICCPFLLSVAFKYCEPFVPFSFIIGHVCIRIL